MEGYTFLMQTYRVGDKICIFGMYSIFDLMMNGQCTNWYSKDSLEAHTQLVHLLACCTK
jgi:hypothetical protein